MKTTTTNTRVLGTMSLIMCLGITTTGAANTCSEVPGVEIVWNMWVDAVDVNIRRIVHTKHVRKLKYRSTSDNKSHTKIITPPKTDGHRGKQYSVKPDVMTTVRDWVENNATADKELTPSFCNCGAVFTVGNRQDDHGFHLMMKINEGGTDMTKAKNYNAWLSKTRGHNAFTENNVKLLVDKTRYNDICGKRK